MVAYIETSTWESSCRSAGFAIRSTRRVGDQLDLLRRASMLLRWPQYRAVRRTVKMGKKQGRPKPPLCVFARPPLALVERHAQPELEHIARPAIEGPTEPVRDRGDRSV